MSWLQLVCLFLVSTTSTMSPAHAVWSWYQSGSNESSSFQTGSVHQDTEWQTANTEKHIFSDQSGSVSFLSKLHTSKPQFYDSEYESPQKSFDQLLSTSGKADEPFQWLQDSTLPTAVFNSELEQTTPETKMPENQSNHQSSFDEYNTFMYGHLYDMEYDYESSVEPSNELVSRVVDLLIPVDSSSDSSEGNWLELESDGPSDEISSEIRLADFRYFGSQKYESESEIESDRLSKLMGLLQGHGNQNYGQTDVEDEVLLLEVIEDQSDGVEQKASPNELSNDDNIMKPDANIPIDSEWSSFEEWRNQFDSWVSPDLKEDVLENVEAEGSIDILCPDNVATSDASSHSDNLLNYVLLAVIVALCLLVFYSKCTGPVVAKVVLVTQNEDGDNDRIMDYLTQVDTNSVKDIHFHTTNVD